MASIGKFSDKPVIGLYTRVYLEETRPSLFQLITQAEDRFEIHILYEALKNVRQFPVQNAHTLTPGQGPFNLGQFWRRVFLGEPAFVNRGSMTLLLEETAFWHMELLHIAFGREAPALLPAFSELPMPLVITFDAQDITCLKEQPEAFTPVLQVARLLLVEDMAGQTILTSLGADPSRIRIVDANPDQIMAAYEEVLGSR